MQQQPINSKISKVCFRNHRPFISSKDAMYLTAYAFLEFVIHEKSTFLCGTISRSRVKDAFDRCGQMHQRHYEKILTHLGTKICS